jgi:2-polyprenyl-3-methyl-5-hydroxy-6-metoxy-1,4-benzoquinol methylase
MPGSAELESHKRAEIASRTPEFMAGEASKPFGWPAELWVHWATVTAAMSALEIPRGAPVLDVGCGSGWTSLFLAEAGHPVVAVDLVPANVELTAARAARWGASVAARVADMDALDLGERFAFALVHDALHHSSRPAAVVAGVSRHLEPGGWALFGEPSLLHDVSPHARATARALGWHERGVSMRRLRRWCRDAGLGEQRRFFQGTHPYEGRGRGFLWQLIRLVAADVAAAPQALGWLAARTGAPGVEAPSAAAGRAPRPAA